MEVEGSDTKEKSVPKNLLGTYFARKQQGEFNSPPSIPPRSLRRTIGNIASIANNPGISKVSMNGALKGDEPTPAVPSRSDHDDFSIRLLSARPSTDTLDPRSSISQYINSHQRLLSTIASGGNLALEGIVNAGKFRPSHSNSFSFSSQHSIASPLDASLSNTPKPRTPIYETSSSYIPPPDMVDSSISAASSLLNQSVYLTPSGSGVGTELDLASRGSLESRGKSSLDVPPRAHPGSKWSLGTGINRVIPEEDEATPRVSPDIPHCLVDHGIDNVDSSMGSSIPRSIEAESELTITPKRRAKISPVKLTGTNAPTSTPTKHLSPKERELETMGPLPEFEPLRETAAPNTLKRSVSSDGRWVVKASSTTEVPKSILMNPLLAVKEPPISVPPMVTAFSLPPLPSAEVNEEPTETSEAHHSFIESLSHSFSVDSPRLDLPNAPSLKKPKLLRSQSAISFQSPVKSPRRELERTISRSGSRARASSGGSSIRSRSPPASRSASPKVGVKVKTILKSIGRIFGGKRKRGTSASTSLFSSNSTKTSNTSRSGDKEQLLGKSIGDESYINIATGDCSYLGLEETHADWMITETRTKTNTAIIPPSLTSSHNQNGTPVELHHDYSLWSLLGRTGPTVSPMIDTSPKHDSPPQHSETSIKEMQQNDGSVDDIPLPSNSNSFIFSTDARRFSSGQVDQRQSPIQNRKPRNSFSFILSSRSSHSSLKAPQPSLSPCEVVTSPDPSVSSPSIPNAIDHSTTKRGGEHTLNIGELSGDGTFLSPEFGENAIMEKD